MSIVYLPENCMDRVASTIKDNLPADSKASGSYYEPKKVVSGMGLPYLTIDVCPSNCMLFWKEYAKLDSCRFVEKQI